jgi:hypothetical protein
MAQRAGFTIPNATTVGTLLDLAEPDAIDFNILGNNRFGVISGCDVTVTGSSWVVNVAPGIVVVDGQVMAAQGQVTLSIPTQSPRFDLIYVDGGGNIQVQPGTEDANPVFPQFDGLMVILASILATPGITPPSQMDVIDKRLMLMDRFTTAVGSGSVLHNADPANPTVTKFDIDYQGRMGWDGDGTALSRVSSPPKTLKVEDNLNVVGNLNAAALAVSGNFTATGTVVSSNLRQGTGNPTGTANKGDLYRDTNTGFLWVYQASGWTQLATSPIPAGFAMPSFTTTAPAGWLLCDGSTKLKTEVGGLWTARPDWITDADHMKLPDCRNRFFGWGQPGVPGGNTSTKVPITIANLPAHRHLTSPSGFTQPSGSHTHTVTVAPDGVHTHRTVQTGSDGTHTHSVVDPGHLHTAPYGAGAFICTVWGAPNKLDGLFNDASHTYNVDPANFTNTAKTNVYLDPSGGEHTHTTESSPSHTHAVTVNPYNSDHTHAISEVSVGGGQPFDITPPFMGMYIFVKT